tara:strand:+ start:667 stop:1101 length:435 start_codon:yes stop_codon:yes gene_type:complete
MDLRKIKKLIELVEESGVVELEVSSGDESIRISMAAAGAQVAPAQAMVPVAPSAALSAQREDQQSPSAPTLKSPMAGVFYQSPDPSSAPFVTIGQQVSTGDVLCIIESMKMMNEVTATVSGVVQEIFVANAEAVSTGTPLFAIS